VGASLLAGCASVQKDAAKSSFAVDDDRIVAIERAAVRQGVTVIWLNQPMKRIAVGS
jgi:hypothetical protein